MNRTEDINVSEKLSKRSKFKERKTGMKKHKKHKKKKKTSVSPSSSENSNDTELQWVEKQVEERIVSSKAPENQPERDEWMNEENYISCVSKFSVRKEKYDIREEEKTKIDPNKPGQSNKELNPYWKDGGDGLPKNSSEVFSKPQILDAEWLKKSLRRAQEQALRDGKSLEEVAAERWGSLKAIHSMIATAEKASNTKQDKAHRRYYNDRNNRDKISCCGTSYSRSRSRSPKSKIREYSGKHSTSVPSHYAEQKRFYQRPKDDDDDPHQQSARRFTNRRTKNWKKNKEKDNETSCEHEKSKCELKEVDVQKISNIREINESLTEADMNKLGAKIVKAELMGDNELAAQLKIQLEHARKLAETNNSNVQDEIITLRKDITRQLQSTNQESRKKKKTVETHISGERVRYFADDDKHSLQEMFEREKGNFANEDEATFAKLASSKRMYHMDDMFEQQIAQTSSEIKRDKRYFAHAIKEHRDLSKSIDNCWWCPDSKNMLKHMIISMDSTICLSLPACASLTTGHCILTPIEHVACQLQLGENTWERLKEVKKTLIDMFRNEDLYPIFFEVYKKRHKFSHMQLECIPLPKEIGYSAPMYFKKALLECETEWSVNRKLVDLKPKDIRHSVPNGLSYFMVEFASHPGYAHIIEDEKMFPKNFAQEIIGGMLDLDCNVWRTPKRQSFDEQRVKVLEFTALWKKYNNEQL